MSTREQLQQAIREEVERHLEAGIGLNVNALALKLSSTYQQSGFTIGEIITGISNRLARENSEEILRELC
jgi:hypothetical protein